jgi:hypothetical protein
MFVLAILLGVMFSLAVQLSGHCQRRHRLSDRRQHANLHVTQVCFLVVSLWSCLSLRLVVVGVSSTLSRYLSFPVSVSVRALLSSNRER